MEAGGGCGEVRAERAVEVRRGETLYEAELREARQHGYGLERRLERIVRYVRHCREYGRPVDPNNIIHLANE